MPSETHREPVQHFYAVTYGWPGLPTTTKIVDLEREVTVGTQILVDRVWWRATELLLASLGASHLGHIRAIGRTRRARSRRGLTPTPSPG